jgi:hypothetical protein
MVDDHADKEESDEVNKKERNDMQQYLILSFVDRTGNAKINLELYNKAFESWVKHRNKAYSTKKYHRQKTNFEGSWSTYEDRLQDCIQKKEFAPNHSVCDECSKMAEQLIVCVYCDVCVHPLPDCCRFRGDQVSCIDCYKTRHFHILPHAVGDRDSCPPMADASNDEKKEVENTASFSVILSDPDSVLLPWP